jgi:hypothetical protein
MAEDLPPTEMVSVPVPIAVLAEKAPDVRLAAVAILFTCSEYVPATASELVLAEAMVASATVALNPARLLGTSSAPKEAFKVSSALVKVPYADTSESRVADCALSCAVWAAPCALVSEDTMELISRPEPMPVEVISELALGVLDAALLEVLDGLIAELMVVSSAVA